jgi:hypothetical protein
MATGAGRRREERTGQPGAEQQGRLGARRRASSARDSRGAADGGLRTAARWFQGQRTRATTLFHTSCSTGEKKARGTESGIQVAGNGPRGMRARAL